MTNIQKGCLIAGCATVVIGIVFFAWIYQASRSFFKSEPEAPTDPAVLATELKRDPKIPLKDGTAVCVLLDTSGSMADGTATPGETRNKIRVAKDTTLRTFEQMEKYQNENPDKTLMVSLLRFSDDVQEIRPLGKPSKSEVEMALGSIDANGGTAIGEAMLEAKKLLNAGGYKKNFILVVTDGENTDGRSPLIVLQALKKLPAEDQPAIYLVAFGIQAAKFDDLKNEGVLTVEAGNASSLQGALDYILYEKILVEEPI